MSRSRPSRSLRRSAITSLIGSLSCPLKTARQGSGLGKLPEIANDSQRSGGEAAADPPKCGEGNEQDGLSGGSGGRERAGRARQRAQGRATGRPPRRGAAARRQPVLAVP